MNKIKVCISGLIFPLTMLHWFWKAFERRDDVELFVLGPYTGAYIPWNGGMDIPTKYIKIPHMALGKDLATHCIPVGAVQSRLPWTPDLWIQIDAGWHFLDKPKAGVVAHIGTDPHVLSGFYDPVRKYSDINFCMQGPYMRDKDHFLPYAYDPTVHYYEELPKLDDACLVGLHYEQRDRLVSSIRKSGYKVQYSIGEVYDDYRHAYCSSRVALNWSSMQDLPARCWEAFGMGLPLLTNRIPDLSNWFVEGEHYLAFSDERDAVKQMKKLIDDPEFASQMASNANRKVAAAHTWDHRVQQILVECKLVMP